MYVNEYTSVYHMASIFCNTKFSLNHMKVTFVSNFSNYGVYIEVCSLSHHAYVNKEAYCMYLQCNWQVKHNGYCNSTPNEVSFLCLKIFTMKI